MKKIIISALALVLLAGALFGAGVATTNAENRIIITLTTDKQKYNAGDTVLISANVSGLEAAEKEIAVFALRFKYPIEFIFDDSDPDGGIINGPVIPESADFDFVNLMDYAHIRLNERNQISILFVTGNMIDFINKDGILFTAKFKIPENVTDGFYDFELTGDPDFIDIHVNNIDVVYGNKCSVLVGNEGVVFSTTEPIESSIQETTPVSETTTSNSGLTDETSVETIDELIYNARYRSFAAATTTVSETIVAEDSELIITYNSNDTTITTTQPTTSTENETTTNNNPGDNPKTGTSFPAGITVLVGAAALIVTITRKKK